MPPTYDGPGAVARAEAADGITGRRYYPNPLSSAHKPETADNHARLRVVEFRPVIKNTLRGFCTVELLYGLRIHDVAVHQRGGAEWVSLPPAPQLENGVQRVVDGKAQYKRVIEWTSRTLDDGFSAAVCAELRRLEPGALAGGST